MFTAIRTVNRRRTVAALAGACIAFGAASPAHAADTVGDTQAEFGKTVVAPQPKAGDTPAEFGKDVTVPQYVEVVKPERTIVREADLALPIALSGLALLVALAGIALPRRSPRAH
jgi:hypothetical protein